ncbi:hypothetical protein HRR83_005373 [Exophiala dermatitidis]|uniref:Uncharacterized protein n=1 Tax=Exophiala dermatitidis TaxID=5970 RepID=A0AAN6IU29_EXODE|nr:hypothetical protein HRR74_005226 [Exophiala dermatitidis]KAJ4518526.1 hypothetical protein HRR73_004107 [Exophiala dermatitidis]KAJ4534025.1 hypothetical protein HRR76_005972 [Exophiala dermatitidis]KAJ4550181.1 hypothetical protein HRR77_003658 [Exophiala dermatitidis]KAJ4571572.1 hypothetical protein HRR81_005603 [Exophiala dermatitidis]
MNMLVGLNLESLTVADALINRAMGSPIRQVGWWEIFHTDGWDSGEPKGKTDTETHAMEKPTSLGRGGCAARSLRDKHWQHREWREKAPEGEIPNLKRGRLNLVPAAPQS